MAMNAVHPSDFLQNDSDPNRKTNKTCIDDPPCFLRRAGSGQQSGLKKSNVYGAEGVRKLHACTEIVLAMPSYLFLSLVMTMIALFLDQFRGAWLSIEHDEWINGLLFACFIFFIMEMLALSFSEYGYVNSILFWADLVGTFSVVLDIPWMVALLFPSGSRLLPMLQGAKAARAGARGTRLFRFIRLVRLAKWVMYFTRSADDADEEDIDAMLSETLKKDKPSHMGELLADQIGRRVVCLVLLVLATAPLLQVDLDLAPGERMALRAIRALPVANGTRQTFIDNEYLKYTGDFKKVIFLAVGGMTYVQEPSNIIDAFRDHEVFSVAVNPSEALARALDEGRIFKRCVDMEQAPPSPSSGVHEHADGDGEGCTLVKFDNRPLAQLSGKLNLTLMLFVVVLLIFGSWLFNSVALKYAVKPIERMLAVVDIVSTSLHGFTQDGDQYAWSPSSTSANETSVPGPGWFRKGMSHPSFESSGSAENNRKNHELSPISEQKVEFETHFLEEAVLKMADLLNMGYGAAGSEIIQRNLGIGNSGGRSVVETFIAGQKLNAVFAFCDIRKFTDTTEVLKENVLRFVNLIGHVVHSNTEWFEGSPNKNIGDAFLLVWKMTKMAQRRAVSMRLASRASRTKGKFSSATTVPEIGSLDLGNIAESDGNSETDKSEVEVVHPSSRCRGDTRLHYNRSREGRLAGASKANPRERVEAMPTSTKKLFPNFKSKRDESAALCLADGCLKAMVQTAFDLHHLNTVSERRLFEQVAALDIVTTAPKKTPSRDGHRGKRGSSSVFSSWTAPGFRRFGAGVFGSSRAVSESTGARADSPLLEKKSSDGANVEPLSPAPGTGTDHPLSLTLANLDADIIDAPPSHRSSLTDMSAASLDERKRGSFGQLSLFEAAFAAGAQKVNPAQQGSPPCTPPGPPAPRAAPAFFNKTPDVGGASPDPILEPPSGIGAPSVPVDDANVALPSPSSLASTVLSPNFIERSVHATGVSAQEAGAKPSISASAAEVNELKSTSPMPGTSKGAEGGSRGRDGSLLDNRVEGQRESKRTGEAPSLAPSALLPAAPTARNTTAHKNKFGATGGLGLLSTESNGETVLSPGDGSAGRNDLPRPHAKGQNSSALTSESRPNRNSALEVSPSVDSIGVDSFGLGDMGGSSSIKGENIERQPSSVSSPQAPKRRSTMESQIDSIIKTLVAAGRRVSMGYGIHYGWAIEGAIGSHLKIDASYLSPHVNTAARLEAATKQFGTMFLLSGEFVRQLSPTNRRLVRQIDNVVLVGKSNPTSLYCWDMWLGPANKQGDRVHRLSPLSVLNKSSAGESFENSRRSNNEGSEPDKEESYLSNKGQRRGSSRGNPHGSRVFSDDESYLSNRSQKRGSSRGNPNGSRVLSDDESYRSNRSQKRGSSRGNPNGSRVCSDDESYRSNRSQKRGSSRGNPNGSRVLSDDSRDLDEAKKSCREKRMASFDSYDFEETKFVHDKEEERPPSAVAADTAAEAGSPLISLLDALPKVTEPKNASESVDSRTDGGGERKSNRRKRTLGPKNPLFDAQAYLALFNSAYKSYESGDWGKADKRLRRCLKEVPNDGPALSLRRAMAKHNSIAPSDWKGYRGLTEK